MIETLRIKGMVCGSCLKVLKMDLESLGAKVNLIQLGSVNVSYDADKISHAEIAEIINQDEFEIILDKKVVLAEDTKLLILNYVLHAESDSKLSDYLASNLYKNYAFLSRNFTKEYGLTIEKYCIAVKMEKVKEMIEMEQLTFSEIAYNVGYQNVATLSKLFKSETGITMSEYKNIKSISRIPLDKLFDQKG